MSPCLSQITAQSFTIQLDKLINVNEHTYTNTNTNTFWILEKGQIASFLNCCEKPYNTVEYIDTAIQLKYASHKDLTNCFVVVLLQMIMKQIVQSF